MTLQTRKPTGAVPWPLVLIEGPEKSGKSWACAELSASGRIGRSLWLDLNEGAADEYGAVPGARYEVIEHDGSWASILGQVVAAKEEASQTAAKGGKPVVLIVDSVTSEWEMLKDWASARAATSAANKRRLKEDPNADVQVSMNLWNDAGARHRRLMTTLMTFPGIVVMTARGKEVASLDANGRPVENTKEYKVEGHKTLAYDASVWVRLSRERPPVVVGCRSVHAGIRPGVDEPQEAKGFTLEWLIFDILKCDPAKAHVRDLVEARPERTPEQIRDEALRPVTTPDRIRELYDEARDSGCEGIELANEHGDTETLAQMLYRIGTERKGAATAAAAGAPEAPAANGNGQHPAAAPEDLHTAADQFAEYTTAVISFATEDDGRELWRAVAASAKARDITREDAKRLQDIIQERIADLKAEAAKAVEGVIVQGLDPEDEWAVKVADIADIDDGVAAAADVRRGMQSGHIAKDRGEKIITAIEVRVASLAGAGVAA